MAKVVILHRVVSTVEFALFSAAEGVFLSLKGVPIANNGYVDVDNIGENDAALLCHTNKIECCDFPNRIGEWYFPCNKTMKVGTLGDPARNNTFYRNRGPSIVRLNCRGNPSQRGCFRCEVPDANNVNQIIFVNIGMFFSTYQ